MQNGVHETQELPKLGLLVQFLFSPTALYSLITQAYPFCKINPHISLVCPCLEQLSSPLHLNKAAVYFMLVEHQGRGHRRDKDLFSVPVSSYPNDKAIITETALLSPTGIHSCPLGRPQSSLSCSGSCKVVEHAE